MQTIWKAFSGIDLYRVVTFLNPTLQQRVKARMLNDSALLSVFIRGCTRWFKYDRD
jgi:hypothetical protein